MDRFYVLAGIERVINGERKTLQTRYRWRRPDTGIEQMCSLGLFEDRHEHIGFVCVPEEFSSVVPSDTIGMSKLLADLSCDPNVALCWSSNFDLLDVHTFGNPPEGLAAYYPVSDEFSGQALESVEKDYPRLHDTLPAYSWALEHGVPIQFCLLDDAPRGLEHTVLSFPPGGRALMLQHLIRFRPHSAEVPSPTNGSGLGAGLLHHLSNSLQALTGQLYLAGVGGAKHVHAAIELAERASEILQFLRQDTDPSLALRPVDINLTVLEALDSRRPLPTPSVHPTLSLALIPMVLLPKDLWVDRFREFLFALTHNQLLALRVETLALAATPLNTKQSAQLRIVVPSEGSAYTWQNSQIAQPLIELTRMCGGSFEQGHDPLTFCFTFPGLEPEPDKRNRGEELERVTPIGGVLVVDDDPLVLRTLASMLSELGYFVFASCGQNDLDEVLSISEGQFQIAIVDGLIPGTSGADIIAGLRQQAPEVVCVGLTGAGPDVKEAMARAGAVAVLDKPINPRRLKHFLSNFRFEEGGRGNPAIVPLPARNRD